MPVKRGAVPVIRAYSADVCNRGELEGHSPEEGQDSRLWARLPWSALEAHQTDASTALATPSSLPFLNVRPCALVHGVVNGYDDLHVRHLGIMVLTRHRRIELRFGGVHPFFVVTARDGGDLAGSRE